VSGIECISQGCTNGFKLKNVAKKLEEEGEIGIGSGQW
jgi:hypothetical protein